MTTLQEAALTALAFIRWNEFGECRTPGFQGPTPTAAEAADALEDALAQQGEPTDDQLVKGVKAMRLFVTKNSVADFKLGYMAALAAAPAQKPVAYITQTEQGPMVWTQEMYDEACTYCDDGEFPVPLYTAAPAPQAQSEKELEFGFDTAPQPAQDVPEVGFGNMPPKFLANGTRFKLSFDTRGRVSSLWTFMDELDGRWVALVAAEDDCHLQSAQLVTQPLAKTCDTCAHYQQGKHPGVSIHDETCYECRSYWGNKWEAKSD